MEVSLAVWLITALIVAGFFVFDFYTHVRTPHEPTLKESALWSLFYIGLACIFGGFLWLYWGEPGNPHQHGMEFFTGYVTEKALSIDNLFVFALIMSAFKIPRKYQQKVLLIGIALALILRTIFILLGAALIEAWSDVFYIFAVFLLYTAIKLIWDEARDAPETDPNDMTVIKWLRKVVPVTSDYEGDHLYVHKKGQFALTPLFVALIAIGLIDVMFALDSIPAIYGITSEPYIVFTTNAFALLGLRQLYFLLDGLLDRLVFLSYGLGIILGFIGVKLLLHALHENNLVFINGGENVAVPEIGVETSLLVILGVLTVTVIASLIYSRLHPPSNHASNKGDSIPEDPEDAAAVATGVTESGTKSADDAERHDAMKVNQQAE
ncbi:MAG: TerC family protein [Corynebacterium sp.]|nr:TerC family protein [Corynebacterium sp.]